MRIAIVHSFYSSLNPSGENSVVSSQISALRDRGHEVVLIAKHTDEESKALLHKPRSILAASNIGGASPHAALKRFDPDIVHVHNLFPNWGSNWLSYWGSKTVATLHNYRTICSSALLWRDGHDCTDCLNSGSHHAILNSCYRDSKIATLPIAWSTRGGGKHSPILNNASALITLNDNALTLFSSLLSKASIHKLPNFADESLAPSFEPKHNFIYVGRLTEEKGIRWLISKWPSGKRLTIAGTGELASFVESVACADPDRFNFLGRIPPERVLSEIRNSAALIIPSMWSEGIPTVALESLQLGTPVLISERCASASELTSSGSGAIFQMGDSDMSLVAGLDEIVGKGQEMRRLAFGKYRTCYSKDCWLDGIEAIYDSVL